MGVSSALIKRALPRYLIVPTPCIFSGLLGSRRHSPSKQRGLVDPFVTDLEFNETRRNVQALVNLRHVLITLRLNPKLMQMREKLTLPKVTSGVGLRMKPEEPTSSDDAVPSHTSARGQIREAPSAGNALPCDGEQAHLSSTCSGQRSTNVQQEEQAETGQRESVRSEDVRREKTRVVDDATLQDRVIGEGQWISDEMFKEVRLNSGDAEIQNTLIRETKIQSSHRIRTFLFACSP